MSSDLWKKDNYVINAKFIHSVKITEYDISKANISALYSKNLISESQYHEFYNMPKQEREVTIGLMERKDPSIYNAIKNAIIEAKRYLFESNNLQDNQIVRIANDAVYVISNDILPYRQYKYMEFLPKDTYTMFCRIANILFFYKNNMGEIELDIKGLGNSEMLHLDYMLGFIGNLLYLIESSNLESVIEYFNGFYEAYMKKELPIPYYRELNPRSCYIVRSNSDISYGISYYEGDINRIDISYNAYVLRELYGCITELFKR